MRNESLRITEFKFTQIHTHYLNEKANNTPINSEKSAKNQFFKSSAAVVKSSCIILLLCVFLIGQVTSQFNDQINEDGNLALQVQGKFEDELDDLTLQAIVDQNLAEWEARKKLKNSRRRVKRDEEVVCYGELGCFRDEGPFDYLDMLPSSPDEISTEFLLYTRKNRQSAQPFSYFNFTSAFFGSNFNASHTTKIMVHGFGSNCQRIWATEMRFALLSIVDSNIICVDWENGAAIPNYVRAAVNTRLVGKQVALLVFWLNENFGTRNQDIHLIGFSLGAHVAGFAGSELKNLSRITGLDPAGPLFEAYDPKTRLDSTDANFVDVIHSNGESLLMGGLGSWQPMGHLDFYPNGGRVQKGCSNLFVGAVRDFLWSTDGDGRSLCNHRRAYKFFTESVSPRCPFPAFPCDSYDKYLTGACFSWDPSRSGNMGYYADRSPPPPTGKGEPLYLITREDEPFCANQFRITIESSPAPSPISTYGGLEAVIVGHDFINETFLVTQTQKESMIAGAVLQRIIVAHPAITEPTQVQLKYTAYQGWLYSGISRWSLDRLIVTNAFGQSLSFCSRGLQLPSGVQVTVTLTKGICINRVIPPVAPSASAPTSTIGTPSSSRPPTPQLTQHPPISNSNPSQNNTRLQENVLNSAPSIGEINNEPPGSVVVENFENSAGILNLNKSSSMDWGEWSPLSPDVIKEQEMGLQKLQNPTTTSTTAQVTMITNIFEDKNCTNCEEIISNTSPYSVSSSTSMSENENEQNLHKNQQQIVVNVNQNEPGSIMNEVKDLKIMTNHLDHPRYEILGDELQIFDEKDQISSSQSQQQQIKNLNSHDEDMPALQVPPESFWKAMENASMSPYQGADPDVQIPPRLSYVLQQLDNQGLGPRSQGQNQGHIMNGHQSNSMSTSQNSHRFENSLGHSGPSGPISGPMMSIRGLIPSSRALKHRPVILSTVRRRSKNLDVAPSIINSIQEQQHGHHRYILGHSHMRLPNMYPHYNPQQMSQSQSNDLNSPPTVLRRIPVTIQFGSRIGKSPQQQQQQQQQQQYNIHQIQQHQQQQQQTGRSFSNNVNNNNNNVNNNNVNKDGLNTGGYIIMPYGNSHLLNQPVEMRARNYPGPTILVAGRRGLLSPPQNQNNLNLSARFNNSVSNSNVNPVTGEFYGAAYSSGNSRLMPVSEINEGLRPHP